MCDRWNQYLKNPVKVLFLFSSIFLINFLWILVFWFLGGFDEQAFMLLASSSFFSQFILATSPFCKFPKPLDHLQCVSTWRVC